MLKKISFAIAILGIAVLLGMLFLPAKEIENLEGVKDNEKVFVEGKVESEKDFGDFKSLKVNGINIYCSCLGDYLGKEIRAEGYVEEFGKIKRIKVLRITEIENKF